MQLSTAAIDRLMQDPENAERMREGQEFFARVLSRSATDPEFRQQLVDNPKPTIVSYFNETHTEAVRPEDIPWDIRFIEPVGDATYILPKVGDEEAELSEADLDVVAGGVSTLLFVGGFLVGAAVVGGMKWGADQLGL